jgi:threonine dehydratase
VLLTGVVVVSSGNFATATSLACKQLGIKCTVVFPNNVYPTQLRTSKKNGAVVEVHNGHFEQAMAHAQEIAMREGALFLTNHNDSQVCAGFGTMALEMLQQNPYLDAIMVPVGAGSLLAATAVVMKHVNPRIQIFGVESANAPLLSQYLQSNRGVAASSVATSCGSILREHLTDVLLIDENERASAIMMVMEAEKTVVQGSGVGAVAAVLSNSKFQKQFTGKTVAAVCTGGNIESSLLARVIDKALVKFGRVARLRVTVEDSPGQLGILTQILSDSRANLQEVRPPWQIFGNYSKL